MTTEALEMLEYSYETIKPGQNREKATCPVCGAKYKWRPRGVGWGIYMGPNVCSWKCQRKAEKQMEDEQMKATQSGFIKVSAFDGHLDEIKARIAAGDTMAEIARDYDRNGATLSGWLQDQIIPAEMEELKAQGRANKKNTRKSAKATEDEPSAGEAKAKNRLVFEPVDTMENPDTTVYRADQVPPELGYVPECSVVCAESTEAAWRALGVIEGICSAALMEEHLPQVLKQLEIIAEALR
jgi:transposase-like protein